MHGDERPAWFVGDLSDPWVAAIADRLPNTFLRRPSEGGLPESWIAADPPPDVVVIHRPILTALDAQRLGRLRAKGETPARVILCFGPHVRHDDLGRWSRHFDAVIPEATAAETIRRIVEPTPRPTLNLPTVRIVSGLHDVRSMLAEVCRDAGYRVVWQGDSPGPSARGLIVWDVPVLEPRWTERIRLHAGTSAVIALLGFADRSTVSLAREAGAIACLEWPCDVDDLVYVLDRTAVTSGPSLAEAGHILPPSPVMARRRSRAEVVDPGRSA